MKTSQRLIAALFAPCAALVLSACGGGTDGTGASSSPTPTNTVSTGAMTKGSVILNGVRYDENAAVITIEGTNATAAALQTGMVIKLRGRDDGVNGTAERIDVENEVRGLVTAVNTTASPQFFTVVGQKVIVDNRTVFANLAGIGAITANTTRVEVHGLRDTNGDIRATRVEAGAGNPDELRGAVSAINLGGNSLTVGGVKVNTLGALFSPAGVTLATLNVGNIVEARGTYIAATNEINATRIELEDREDDVFDPRGDDKVRVEGFISGFTVHPGAFKVGTRNVRTSATTRFENGTAADLANNVEVEAEGPVDASGTLQAVKISFDRTRVILTGLPTAVNTVARTLTVFGKTVQVNDLTELRTPNNGGSLADIVANVDRVEVRAFIDSAGNIVAERITEIGNSGGGKDIIQARVNAENEVTFTLTLLTNINVLLGGAGVQFQDANDAVITRAQFFAAVTAASGTNPGTLVKVKGTFAGGTLAAEEAELEN